MTKRIKAVLVGFFMGLTLSGEQVAARAMNDDAPMLAPVAAMSAPTAAATRGKRYVAASEGWSLHLPRGWRVRSAQGDPITLDVRRRRAGRLFVRFQRGVTYHDLRVIRRRSVTRDQIRFKGTIGYLRGWSTDTRRVVEVNMVATTAQPRNQPALSLSVISPRGVLSIIGYTTRPRIVSLRKLLRGLAKSVSFFAPQRTPAFRKLAAHWLHQSHRGDARRGVTLRISLLLCPSGTFRLRRSQSANRHRNSSDKVGTWNAKGQTTQGTLALRYSSGYTTSSRYHLRRRRARQRRLSATTLRLGKVSYVRQPLPRPCP